MKRSLVIVSMMFMSLGLLSQSDSSQTRKTNFSVEIDPATFGFGGYGIHLRIQPKNSDHLLIGAGTYAMDFPSVLVDMNKTNKDQGWHVRLKQGYGLFAEHHFTEVNKKFFLGTQLAIQQYEIQKDFYDGESKYTNLLLMATGGYTVQPFDFDLYFKFWGGIGYTGKISGENSIDNAEYDISPILVFAALHIGYTF